MLQDMIRTWGSKCLSSYPSRTTSQGMQIALVKKCKFHNESINNKNFFYFSKREAEIKIRVSGLTHFVLRFCFFAIQPSFFIKLNYVQLNETWNVHSRDRIQELIYGT